MSVYVCLCKIKNASLVYIISLFIVYVFTNSSGRAGCVTRSIFKQSLTGLNSDFSFF